MTKKINDGLTTQQRYYLRHGYKPIREWRIRNKDKVAKSSKRHYERHKKEIFAYKMRYNSELKFKVLKILGDKCIQCGESDWRCLQIDHINGNGANERRIHSHFWMLRQILAGSKDYQLLCANCNWKKKFERDEK